MPEPNSFSPFGIHDRIATILTRHVSPILAAGLLTRALRECGLAPAGVSRDNVILLYGKLEAGIRLFVEPGVMDVLWLELDALASEFHPHGPVLIALATDADLTDARAQARLFCQRVRARPVAAERVVTIVSELARNIVSHTPGGQIELSSDGAPAITIRITATDRGGGIAKLAEVLVGKPRSHTSLGKGILGVKRLADTFAIQTSDSGTRVECEVRL